MENIHKYILEADDYVGKNYFNTDDSTFLLVPDDKLNSWYELLKDKIEQSKSCPLNFVARKWSSIDINRYHWVRRICLEQRELELSTVEQLCRVKYCLPYLSPQDLADLPDSSMGGAYLQYMNDAKFYEFDKNPLSPDSDMKWLIRLMRQTHDFYHLVGEFYHYGWEGGYLVYNDPRCFGHDMLVLIEEICIYAFMMGQVRLKEVIPTVADWANNGYGHCAAWLTQAYPIWRDTQDFSRIEHFEFPRFIGDCEKFTYASMKLGQLEAEVCVDDFLNDLHRLLPPLPLDAGLEEREARDMVLESFERGLRSRPLICFEWDRYLANDLNEVRAFLNIPRRKRFRDGSHYLKADLVPDSAPVAMSTR
ncbi:MULTISPECIES: Coq4 family protein [unclassified Sphingomonas]|uniref:Coq4 family protein n=1 Tax=unclassified Sphingomonas TaxID=196159 RepID=UPI0018D2121B|nr:MULTISPECIES: Coq4 family protein [unclassified Sphingomonas]